MPALTLSSQYPREVELYDISDMDRWLNNSFRTSDKKLYFMDENRRFYGNPGMKINGAEVEAISAITSDSYHLAYSIFSNRENAIEFLLEHSQTPTRGLHLAFCFTENSARIKDRNGFITPAAISEIIDLNK